MSTITKERVAGIASGEKCYTHDDVVELARIALASLEAEAVAQVLSSRAGNNTSTIDKALPEGTLLYTAPPAPVSVPAAYEHTEDFSEYHEGWNACRAAMLQGADGD